MNFVATLYGKAFERVSRLDALVRIIESFKNYAKNGGCGDFLKLLNKSNFNGEPLILPKNEFLACFSDFIANDCKETLQEQNAKEIIYRLVDVAVGDDGGDDLIYKQQSFYKWYKSISNNLHDFLEHLPVYYKKAKGGFIGDEGKELNEYAFDVLGKIYTLYEKMGMTIRYEPKTILSSSDIESLETLRGCLKNNNHVDGMDSKKLKQLDGLLHGTFYFYRGVRKLWRGPAFDPAGYTDDNGNRVMPEFTTDNLESKAAEIFTERVRELENKGHELSTAAFYSPEYKTNLNIEAWEKKQKEAEEALNALIAKNDGPHLKIFYDQLLVMRDPITGRDSSSRKIPREPAEVKANVIQNLNNGKWKRKQLNSWAAALPKEVVVEYSELRAQAEDFARKLYAAKENPFKFLSEKVYNDLIENSPISEEEAKAWVKTVKFTGLAFDKSMKDEIKQELARLYRLAGDDLPPLTISRTKTRSNQEGKTIHLGKTYGDSIKTTLWHEFGHFIDNNTAASITTLGHFIWLNSEKESDGKNARLADCIKGMPAEYGVKVKGIHPYAAKYYTISPFGGETTDKKQYPRTSGGLFYSDEVLSMALGSSQDDMGRSSDPSHFMARKHLDIVAGLLKERQERTMKEREAAAEKEEETRAAS